ncbi:hypothetical protein QW180_02320 [Vibrio sinaloensis]|nr:hypothetical protein [Vibrio sinaloensis]
MLLSHAESWFLWGVGIVLGAILLNDYSIGGALGYVGSTVSSVFIEDGGLNTWNMSIVGFLLLLGMMTALLTLSGGTRAFAEWAQTRVKKQARFKASCRLSRCFHLR